MYFNKTTNVIFSFARKSKIIFWSSEFAFFILICIYVSMTMLPLLSSGYYSDDMITSTIKGDLSLRGVSLFDYILDQIESKILYTGRFLPLHSFLISIMAYYLNEIFTYKIVTLLNVLINISLFGYLVKTVTKDFYLTIFMMVLIPTFFQFRLYHDPILSFFGIMQFFLSFVLISLIFLFKHIESGKKSRLFLSVIFYNLALYVYEVSFFLITLHFFMIIYFYKTSNKRFIIDKAKPFVWSIVVAIILNLVGRLLQTNIAGYSGVKVSLIPTSVSKTFLMQAYASLPLSYFYSNPSNLFQHDIQYFISNVHLVDFIIVVILMSVCFVALKNVMYNKLSNFFMVFGSIMLCAPAVMVSMSTKYQDEILSQGFGIGYIPVFIQYFGMLLLMSGVYFLVLKEIKHNHLKIILNIILIISFSIVALINVQSNRIVVDKSNIDLHYRRNALVESLGNNLLKDVPVDSTLLVDDRYVYDPYPNVKSHLKGWAAGGYRWKNDAFIYQYGGKKVKTLDSLTDLLAGCREPVVDFSDKNFYLLVVSSYDEKYGIAQGYVNLSKINRVVINESDLNRSRIDIRELSSTY